MTGTTGGGVNIILEPPAPFLNSNQRLHWRKKAERVKAWRNAAREAAFDAHPTEFTYAQVICHIRFPDDICRDVANWYPTAKSCLDGIVEAGGFLTDDSDKYVVGPDMRREYPNGSPRVTITIREIHDAA